MSYSNAFLQNFRPVFFGILKERGIRPERVELEVIDEESERGSMFEPVDVRDVLEQLGEDLNFLSIYTERPAYFYEFAEKMYEENGLVVMFFSKRELFPMVRQHFDIVDNRREGGMDGGNICTRKMVLDFEWEGACYSGQMGAGRSYIPIHKKPWKQGENLDIIVPIGYNTVIVKGMQNQRKKLGRDRFEEAFYGK